VVLAELNLRMGRWGPYVTLGVLNYMGGGPKRGFLSRKFEGLRCLGDRGGRRGVTDPTLSERDNVLISVSKGPQLQIHPTMCPVVCS
jgi:hypothetical protein